MENKIFYPTNHKCIPIGRICDGTEDCEDGSDEESNPKTANCSKLLNLISFSTFVNNFNSPLMTKINDSSTSKISECSVRGWIPKKDLELETMSMFNTELDISHEDCRKRCQKDSRCISFYAWRIVNRTGIYADCRRSNVVLNVFNVERTNRETDLVGLKDGNNINFIFIFILMNAKYGY